MYIGCPSFHVFRDWMTTPTMNASPKMGRPEPGSTTTLSQYWTLEWILLPFGCLVIAPERRFATPAFLSCLAATLLWLIFPSFGKQDNLPYIVCTTCVPSLWMAIRCKGPKHTKWSIVAACIYVSIYSIPLALASPVHACILLVVGTVLTFWERTRYGISLYELYVLWFLSKE